MNAYNPTGLHATIRLMMKTLQVVTVLVILPMLGHAIQTEYFVTPNEGTPCPALPCHTISHYLENTTQYFTSNTRISFLDGAHEINKSGVFHIKDVSNLTLTRYNVSGSHAAKIMCMEPASLRFENIVNLVVKHLSVLYCGYPLMQLNDDKGRNSSVAVVLRYITSLKLSHISVENSIGFGVFGANILGDSSISYSRFMFNNYYTLSSTSCSSGPGTCRGGNMLLFYETLRESVLLTTGNTTSVISIDSCIFSYGVDISEVPDNIQSRLAGGLTMWYYNGVQHKVDISIRNVVSTRNIAKNGANFLFNFLRGYFGTVKFIHSTSSMANWLLPIQDSAGFIFYYGVINTSAQVPTINHTLLIVSDSKFYDNNGGGAHIHLYKQYNLKYQVIIRRCVFQRNENPAGSSLLMVQPRLLPSTLGNTSGIEVWLLDTKFMNDTIPESYSSRRSDERFNVVTVNGLKNLKIVNCTFEMNKQTVLQVIDSTLYFGGHVIFSENNGTFGGAMLLQSGSIFYLMPHTHVQIANNHAKRGGGIYVEDEVTVTTMPCFFQVLNLQYPNLPITAMITLENNTADEAGSALYGGSLDFCFLQTSYPQSVFIYSESYVFDRILQIVDNNLSSVSQISSKPVSMHLCKRNVLPSSGVYPGQMFQVPIVLYGQRNGSVPGVVHSKLQLLNRRSHFAPLQETQKTDYLCTNLTYTIFSTRQYELIDLRIDGVQLYEEEFRFMLKLLLLPCPPGFQLSTLTAQCECAPLLRDRGLLCNISGAVPLVQRTKSVWISTHPNGNDTLLHDNCPLDYCKLISLWLQLNHPDEQCAYGRSGLLCGRCKSNLSLALGTSQCLKCTNTYLALLLPFALAGLMLVLFLIICNLTVSMGTVNGLIFYANIVRVNHAFFFMTPTTSALQVFQQVLAVFIAWLNLDLGIETCFVRGMDAYIQTWLQFAFPFYIWTIVGVIIYLSRRSIIIVKLVGSSAVSVLATLFLLSYAKLQRTVITAFSFTYLQNYYGDGRSLAVWLYDGNVPFLQEKHIALFLMALAVTVFFLLPFTLLLLFAPCIQASNHFLIKRIKMNLLPLLDAYQAPYKDKFRFWTGLLVVVRSVLLVGFGLNILGDPDINHLLTVTVLAVLLSCTWIIGIVYKNTALNILETSFILNLLILSSWTIYNRRASNGDSSDGQTGLVCTSTGVAFATFICILLYHTYRYLKSTKFHSCFQQHKVKRGDRGERGAVEGSEDSALDPPPHRPPTRTVVELRESLLTDN